MRGVDARRSWLQYESIFIEIALLLHVHVHVHCNQLTVTRMPPTKFCSRLFSPRTRRDYFARTTLAEKREMLPRLGDDNPFSVPKTGSGISGLFADDDDDSGASLSFSRPVAPGTQKPKKEKKSAASAPAAPAAAAPAPPADGPPITLFAALVNVFRMADGAWQPVGQAGLALVGGPLPKPFQLVQYDPSNKRPFAITTVGAALGVPSPQYISLEDDAKQSWSMYFPTLEEATNLLQHVTMVRALSAGFHDARPMWVSQDVSLGKEAHAQAGDIIGVRQQSWALRPLLSGPPSGPSSTVSPLGLPQKVEGDEKKPHKVVLDTALGQPDPAAGSGSCGGASSYERALLGMAKDGVRYVACSAAGRCMQVRPSMRRPPAPPRCASRPTPLRLPPHPAATPSRASRPRPANAVCLLTYLTYLTYLGRRSIFSR